MQKLKQLILPIVLLSVLAIDSAKAVQCFHCDSSVNSECNDISTSSTIKPVDCSPSIVNSKEIGSWLHEITRIAYFEGNDENLSVPMVCQKFTAKKNGEDAVSIYRGCQLEGGKTDLCGSLKTRAAKKNIEILDCNTCTEDMCNSSIKLTMTSLWILLIPTITFKLFF